MELLSELGYVLSSSQVSLYLKALIIIEILIAIYMVVVFIQIVIVNPQLKALYLLSAIFTLGVTMEFEIGINIYELIGSLKEYKILNFLLGFIMTSILMIALLNNNTTFLSPILLFFSVILFIPALDGSLIRWSSEIAIFSSLGKLISMTLFYSLQSSSRGMRV